MNLFHVIEGERLTSWLDWILLTEREEVCAGSAKPSQARRRSLLNMFEFDCCPEGMIRSSLTMASLTNPVRQLDAPKRCSECRPATRARPYDSKRSRSR